MTSERTLLRRRHRRALAAGALVALVAPTALTARPAAAATVNVALCATAGTTTLPVNGTTPTTVSVPVWAYVSGSCTGVTAPTAPGGPTIVVDQGDQVTVTLGNGLNEPTALLVQGQGLRAETTGVAAGGTRSYTFTASKPGTFLYEAAPIANAQHQVAMGLYGAFVVRPVPGGSAYGTPATAYGQDAVVVLSELDPALNGAAGGPASFDMRNYKARYRLVNGRAHPASAPITATAGTTLLVRYVNAGIDSHSLTVLGLRQTIVGNAGSGLTYSRTVVADTLGAGQTLDALVRIPASAAAGTRYPLYDGALSLHNANQRSTIGGMLTTIDVAAATGAPLVSGLTATPSGFTATVTATAPATVVAAEYALDAPLGTPGSGTGATVVPAGSTATVSGSYTVTAAGTHTVSVRGRDSSGVWGPAVTTTFTITPSDTTGPATTGLATSPSPATPATTVTVSATASDAATGGAAIAAGELVLDNGAPLAMLVTPTGPATATVAVSIPAGLSLGNHSLSVRSRDAGGNWGAAVAGTLAVTAPVDGTGPVTSGVSASPNPNNGAKPFNASTPAVRVFATVTDAISNVAAAEGFIDQASPAVTTRGFVFAAADGAWSSATELVYADIPLTTIGQLTAGTHTIGVRGKDAAGNWTTALVTTQLVIDKTAPTTASIVRSSPNPVPVGTATVDFTVTFSEPVEGVTAANLTVVAGAGLTGATVQSVTGSGATRTVTVTTGSGGTLGLNLGSAAGITDLAGNALGGTVPVVGQVYTVLTPPLYFSTAGNTNPPGVGGTPDDADVYRWNGQAFSRLTDVTTMAGALPGTANVDGYDRVDDTHFYVSFTADVNVSGLGIVADEDVVYYDAGTWSMFFDGSARGLTSATDLDAISIAGGVLYFSTDTNVVPPGAGGTGDDADVYRWNGGSTYTRMIDASAVGWSTANVDGLVWVDATHVYLSYADNTTVPTLGAVQDEDVVRLDGTAWSVYFDGTARGLTSANLDVDAFDVA